MSPAFRVPRPSGTTPCCWQNRDIASATSRIPAVCKKPPSLIPMALPPPTGFCRVPFPALPLNPLLNQLAKVPLQLHRNPPQHCLPLLLRKPAYNRIAPVATASRSTLPATVSLVMGGGRVVRAACLHQ